MADYTHIVIKISGNQITIRASKFWYGTCPKGKCLKKFFVKTALESLEFTMHKSNNVIIDAKDAWAYRNYSVW